MVICIQIAGDICGVSTYYTCDARNKTIDKTIGKWGKKWSNHLIRISFALLTLSWFQILLTEESPAQGLIICTRQSTQITTHTTKLNHSLSCNEVQYANAETGLGIV